MPYKQIVVPLTKTAIPVTALGICYKQATLMADPDNTGTAFTGDATTQGAKLRAGDSKDLVAFPNAAGVYADRANAVYAKSNLDSGDNLVVELFY